MSCNTSNTDNCNPGLEDQDQDLEPTEGLSSAAACISIELLAAVESGSAGSGGAGAAFFKPVYTHQCFQHEVIPGFEPFHAEAQEAKDLASEYYCFYLTSTTTSATTTSTTTTVCTIVLKHRGLYSFNSSILLL